MAQSHLVARLLRARGKHSYEDGQKPALPAGDCTQVASALLLTGTQSRLSLQDRQLDQRGAAAEVRALKGFPCSAASHSGHSPARAVPAQTVCDTLWGWVRLKGVSEAGGGWTAHFTSPATPSAPGAGQPSPSPPAPVRIMASRPGASHDAVGGDGTALSYPVRERAVSRRASPPLAPSSCPPSFQGKQTLLWPYTFPRTGGWGSSF